MRIRNRNPIVSIFGNLLGLAFKAVAATAKFAWRMFLRPLVPDGTMLAHEACASYSSLTLEHERDRQDASRVCRLPASPCRDAMLVRGRVANKPGEARLLYVVDGDTLKMDVGGRERSVRLLGIDAPESKMNEHAFEQAKAMRISPEAIVGRGVASREKMKTLVKRGDVLRLEFDKTKYDKFGRLLAYVWRDNMMLNAHMLTTGYARPMFFGENTKHRKSMEEAYGRYLEFARNARRREKTSGRETERGAVKTESRTPARAPESSVPVVGMEMENDSTAVGAGGFEPSL